MNKLIIIKIKYIYTLIIIFYTLLNILKLDKFLLYLLLNIKYYDWMAKIILHIFQNFKQNNSTIFAINFYIIYL